MKHPKFRTLALLFLYLPIFMGGILITYFFPTEIIFSLKLISPLFLIFLIILTFIPSGRLQIPHTTLKKNLSIWQRQIFWFVLQIVFFCLFITLINSLDLTKNYNQSFLLYSLFPWPFYLLIAFGISSAKQKPKLPQVRASLWPLFKNKLNTIFGLGIDFFIKQAALLIQLISIIIFLVFVLDQINSLLNLTLPTHSPLSIMLVSTSLFLILASAFWRRLTRYVWAQHYSIPVFLAIYVNLIFIILLIANLILKYATPYLPFIPKIKFSFHWPSSGILLLWAWQILMAPIFVKWIMILIQGQSLRKNILQSLVLPIILAIIWNKLIFNPVLALVLAIFSLGLILFLFQDPETENFIQLTNKKISYPNLLSLRNLCFLIISILIVYLLTSLPFIVLYIYGVFYPVFLTFYVICLFFVLYPTTLTKTPHLE